MFGCSMVDLQVTQQIIFLPLFVFQLFLHMSEYQRNQKLWQNINYFFKITCKYMPGEGCMIQSQWNDSKYRAV